MMVTVKRSICTISHGQILWTDIRRLIGIYILTHCSKSVLGRYCGYWIVARKAIKVTAGKFLRRAVEGRLVEYS